MEPEKFWRLLPSELDILQDAALARRRMEQRFIAAMTANLMNVWIKRSVTVDQLLGLKPSRSKGEAANAVWQKIERQRREKRGEQTTAAAPGV